MKGMIKFYNKDKGFGFVVGEDNQEYYFNHKAIAYGELPAAGCHCEFEPKQNNNNSNKKPEIAMLQVVSMQQAQPAVSCVTPNPTPRRHYPRKQQVEVVYQPKSTLDLLLEAEIGVYVIMLGICAVIALILGVIDFVQHPIAFITDPIKITFTAIFLTLVGLLVFFWKKKPA